jgi:DNA-directed RNA polymerase subunit RPC12/RpoP
MSNDGKLDGSCQDCGQAFSEFLHEMEERNAKVVACPRCGKPHPHKRPKSDKPVSGLRRARKTV